MKNKPTDWQIRTIAFINKVLDMNLKAYSKKGAMKIIDEYLEEARAVSMIPKIEEWGEK